MNADTLMSPLEAILTTSLALWMAFYLVNHADMFSRLRAAAMSVLPRWVAYPLSCPICFAWWVLVAACVLAGWTPLVLWVPPVVLLLDLAYLRLRWPQTATITVSSTGGTTTTVGRPEGGK